MQTLREDETLTRVVEENFSKPELITDLEKRKREYISFRSFGFTELQASRLSGFRKPSIESARNNDTAFKVAEEALASIPEMEQHIARVRNMGLLLHAHQDVALAFRSLTDGPEELSEREFRLHLLSRSKPLQTTQQTDQVPVGGVNLTINVGEAEISSVEARRAVAHQLLQDFDASKKYNNPDQQPLIEGEVLAND